METAHLCTSLSWKPQRLGAEITESSFACLRAVGTGCQTEHLHVAWALSLHGGHEHPKSKCPMEALSVTFMVWPRQVMQGRFRYILIGAVIKAGPRSRERKSDSTFGWEEHVGSEIFLWPFRKTQSVIEPKACEHRGWAGSQMDQSSSPSSTAQ